MKESKHTTAEYEGGAADKLFLREAGISYSVAGLLPQILSLVLVLLLLSIVGEGYAQLNWVKYLSYLLPQLCFASTAVVFFRRSKQPVRQTVGRCKWQYYLVALLLQFGLLSLSSLNGYFIEFLKFLGYQSPESTLPELSGWNLLPAILVIALLPAIFEELLFRGILTGSMKGNGWGIVPSVLLCGGLFSLFHGNPEQTLYQFVCGACYTLIAWRSGSILPTAIAHFCNNALVLTLTSVGIESLPLAVTVCAGVCLAGALTYLIFFDKRGNQKGAFKEGKTFFFYAAAGILICALSWLITLITGFTNG